MYKRQGYGHPHPGPYGSPYHHPTVHVAPAQPPRRSMTPYIVAAIVTAGLLAGGGTVFLLNQKTKNEGRGPGPASPASTVPTPSSPSPAGPTPGPATTPGGAPTTAGPTGNGPAVFAGTWQSSFNAGSGANYRTITISGGPYADVTIQGSGTLDDGTSYSCRWHTTATGGSGGGPLHLGPSSVTQANPTSACQPGSASDLVLLSDGRMRRDFVDSGTRDASLTYSKTG